MNASSTTAASAAATARTLAQTAKRASRHIAAADAAVKNAVLRRFAALLRAQSAQLVAANDADIKAAEGLDAPLRERLRLNAEQISATATGIEHIAAQDDPIGVITDLRYMPSGIQVGKMRVPLGVILMIYESRPSVTADAAALALKAGNAVILRGGKEAQHSNRAIGDCLNQVLEEHNLSGAAQVVADSARAVVGELLSCGDDIDLVIPRGGRALIERVAQEAHMPVLKHLDGNCHVYVDAGADLTMAQAIIINAKTRRYGVCNAAESVLVHAAVAAKILPPLAKALTAAGVEIRACEKTRQHAPQAVAAAEEDWRKEYLAPIISIKIVDSADDAIAHINQYGSGHTDAIVTGSLSEARRFLREVDSSSVLVNASTAFADGGEFGLGAEIGISTDKLHARGPVGALGLTTQKYIVWGGGECRASGDKEK